MKSRRIMLCLRIFLLIVVICFFVPVVVFQVDHDADCCANDSCHDCFCLCHALVLDIPSNLNVISSNDKGTTLPVYCSNYSLLLVPAIFRPPVA